MVFFEGTQNQGHECEPLIIACRSCSVKIKKLSDSIGVSALNLPVLHARIQHKTEAIAQPIYCLSSGVSHVLQKRFESGDNEQDGALKRQMPSEPLSASVLFSVGVGFIEMQT